MVPDKAERVAHFHNSTLHALSELTAAAGLDHPSEFHKHHISRRISPKEVVTFADLYPSMAEGELLKGTQNELYARAWAMADAHSFRAKMA